MPSAANMTYFADGLHEFLIKSQVIDLETELGDPARSLEATDMLFATDAAVVNGVAGGPVLDSRGYLLGISTTGRNPSLVLASTQLRGEGAHHLALDAGVLMNLYAQEKGDAEAQRAFSCSPPEQQIDSSQELPYAERASLSEGPAAAFHLPHTLAGPLSAVTPASVHWNSQLVERVHQRLPEGARREAWLRLGSALPEFSTFDAVRDRIATGRIVLPEDLYPGLDADKVVAQWVFQSWSARTLSRLQELSLSGGPALSEDDRRLIAEEIARMKETL
jgi:hypothetical protein